MSNKTKTTVKYINYAITILDRNAGFVIAPLKVKSTISYRIIPEFRRTEYNSDYLLSGKFGNGDNILEWDRRKIPP